MKRTTLFILAFVLWLLLAWPVNPVRGGLVRKEVLVGALVAVLVAAVMGEARREEARRWLNPVRWFWAVAYAVVFLYYVAKANIDVAYRVLHPAMPIHPGIVKVKTGLKTAAARTLLGNSITLTPGTMTVDVTDDGTLYIHWINVRTTEVEEATKQIAGRFEWFIKRILE